MIEFLVDTMFAGIAGGLIGVHTSLVVGTGMALALALLFNNLRLIRLAIERNHKD